MFIVGIDVALAANDIKKMSSRHSYMNHAIHQTRVQFDGWTDEMHAARHQLESLREKRKLFLDTCSWFDGVDPSALVDDDCELLAEYLDKFYDLAIEIID